MCLIRRYGIVVIVPSRIQEGIVNKIIVGCVEWQAGAAQYVASRVFRTYKTEGEGWVLEVVVASWEVEKDGIRAYVSFFDKGRQEVRCWEECPVQNTEPLLSMLFRMVQGYLEWGEW